MNSISENHDRGGISYLNVITKCNATENSTRLTPEKQVLLSHKNNTSISTLTNASGFYQ